MHALALVMAAGLLQGTAPPRAEVRSSAPARGAAGTPVVPGQNLTVWLVTMGQGDQVWERFGHNGIRIRDASSGVDVVFNWGVFDFDEPGFLVRFLTGDTRYWVEGARWSLVLDAYRRLNRSVWVQQLNLTPAQRQSLWELIARNARPENKYYRYDYYLDNCSTRVRDVIDTALGGRLRAATASRLTTTTFRWHTRRLLQDQVALYTGIQLALGEPADRPISSWEEMFLPTRMQATMRHVQVRSDDGALIPLVISEEQLFAATRAPEPETVPDRRLGAFASGAVLALVMVLLGRLAPGTGVARRALAVLLVAWAGLSAALGIAITFAWTATRHVFWAHNENLLLVSPLAILLVVSLPGARAPSGRATLARSSATLLALLALIALAVKALPAFDQINGEVIAFVLPVAIAVAWCTGRLTSSGTSRVAA
jgi:hypothetical protein